METLYLVFNRSEWLSDALFKWTAEEIDSADKETGLIGRKHGVDCYLARPLSVLAN